MPAVKTHDASLATRLVDEAGRILAADGVGSLTLRRLATATGTSTMAVYTLFGDKTGLLRAMHREGFERLGAASRAAADDGADPLASLAAVGVAYRATALANPHLYRLMFGNAVPGFTPDELGQKVAEASYQPLVDGVSRCLAAGQLRGAAADRIAFHLWATAHGMVSLELNGLVPGDAAARERAYTESMIYAVTPFLPAS